MLIAALFATEAFASNSCDNLDTSVDAQGYYWNSNIHCANSDQFNLQGFSFNASHKKDTDNFLYVKVQTMSGGSIPNYNFNTCYKAEKISANDTGIVKYKIDNDPLIIQQGVTFKILAWDSENCTGNNNPYWLNKTDSNSFYREFHAPEDFILGPVIKDLEIFNPKQDETVTFTNYLRGVYRGRDLYNKMEVKLQWSDGSPQQVLNTYNIDSSKGVHHFSFPLKISPNNNYNLVVKIYDSENNSEFKEESVVFNTNYDAEDVPDTNYLYEDISERFNCDPSMVDVSIWNLQSQAEWVFCKFKNLTFTYIAGHNFHNFWEWTINKKDYFFDNIVPFAYFTKIKEVASETQEETEFKIKIDVPAVGNSPAQSIIFIDLADINYTDEMVEVIDYTEKYLEIFLHLLIALGIFTFFIKKSSL